MADRFAGDPVLAQALEALSRKILDGILVLGPGMSEALHISAPGDVIWSLLREPLTVSDLVTNLSESYGVSSETVRAQSQPTLDALLDGGALSVTPVASPPPL